MKPYADLTELGRARRLRPLVVEALGRYDIEPVRIRLLSNDFNGIFRIDTADGDRLVMRVGLPSGAHSPQQVAAETAFVEAIAEGTDLAVPRPVRNRDGERFTVASADGVPEPRMCVLMTWVPGIDLANRMSLDNWRRLGGLMARLHDFAQTWSPPSRFHTITYDSVIHFGEPTLLFDPVADAYLTVKQRDVLERGIEIIERGIAELPGERVVVHGDLHQWNVKVERDRLHPLDFEDLQWAHPIQDAATTLYYVWWRPERHEYVEAFRSGYTEHRPWVERWEGEVDLHVLARGVDLINFVIWSADDDPGEYADLIDRNIRALGDFLSRM